MNTCCDPQICKYRGKCQTFQKIPYAILDVPPAYNTLGLMTCECHPNFLPGSNPGGPVILDPPISVPTLSGVKVTNSNIKTTQDDTRYPSWMFPQPVIEAPSTLLYQWYAVIGQNVSCTKQAF